MNRSRAVLGLVTLSTVAGLVTVPAAAATDAGTATSSPGVHTPTLRWSDTKTGSTSRLRGLAPVSRSVVWASGSEGTVLRTVDGGRHWSDVAPRGAAALQFRDIEAFDRRTAVALSIGEGTDSRIYRTTNGGATWRRTFTNTDPRAFYDCMAFFDRQHGLAMSDPVDGKFRLIRTSDGGRSWSLVNPSGMPPALPGEAGFAASGTCLSTSGPRDVWLATGIGATARVFHSGDRGRHWTVVSTPVVSTPAGGGIFSVAFRDRRHGIAVGGDFTDPTSTVAAAAWTRTGGRTWTLASAAHPTGGYRSGVAWLPRLPWTGRFLPPAVAVGPTGSDVSLDGGRSWATFDETSLDAVACTWDRSCWGSGENGRVARLQIRR